MRQVVYTQRLSGRLTTVAPGVLYAALSSADAPATVHAQLSFADRRHFTLMGEIRFAGHDALRFRTLDGGRLDLSPDPALRHGTTVLEICGGSGEFAGASGRITSNFVVTEEGEITDHHLGVVFVAVQAREQP